MVKQKQSKKIENKKNDKSVRLSKKCKKRVAKGSKQNSGQLNNYRVFFKYLLSDDIDNELIDETE